MRTLKWIVTVSALYLILAVLALVFLGIPVEISQIVYVIVLAMPLYIKRLAKWLKLDLLWFK